MITSRQMRAARAMLGIDQKQLAESAGVSLPTIQRMEASRRQVRGKADTLTRVIEAFGGPAGALIVLVAATVARHGVRLRPQAATDGIRCQRR